MIIALDLDHVGKVRALATDRLKLGVCGMVTLQRSVVYPGTPGSPTATLTVTVPI